METSTALTVTLTILTIIAAGIYTTNNTIHSDSSLPNQPNTTPQTENTLYQEREIKGRNTTQENNTDTRHGIITYSTPVAGEKIRITLYQNGNRLTNENIYINDKKAGKTSETGSLTTTTPDKNQITISTDTTLKPVTKKVLYKQKLADINFIQPLSGEQLTNYKKQAIIGIQPQENINYTIKLDNKTIETSSLEKNRVKEFKHTMYLEETGQHQLQINIQNRDGETQTETLNFSTNQKLPPIQIEMNTPSPETEINDYLTNFDYQVNSPIPYNFQLLINGETVQKTLLDENQSLNSYQTYFQPGAHNWTIKAESNITNHKQTKTQTFTTTETPPIAEIQLEYPTNQLQTGESFRTRENYRYMFTANTFTNTDWKLYHIKPQGEEELEFEGNLGPGQNQVIETNQTSWDTGQHQWYIKMTSPTGETLETPRQGFEVTQ